VIRLSLRTPRKKERKKGIEKNKMTIIIIIIITMSTILKSTTANSIHIHHFNTTFKCPRSELQE